MAKITIEIPDRIIDALEAHRKENKAPRPNPDNPEEIIMGPVHSSVEQIIQLIVNQGIAPVAATVPTPEQKALADEIREKTKLLDEMSLPTISVKRG